MSSKRPFTPCLDDERLAAADAQWQTLQANMPVRLSGTQRQQAITALALSPFVLGVAQKHTEWLFSEPTTNELATEDRTTAMRTRYLALNAINDENELMRQLRDFRQREMLIIAWRDLNGLARVQETIAHLSLLADLSVSTALQFIERDFESRHGLAQTQTGLKQQLLVLGMGKLGGEELNFSSDIDLIFAYAEDGESNGPRKLEHHVYFTRVGQKLIHLLSTPTADGIVFRTDMRLRPYGDSGPLAMSLDAMEDYYQEQGREWERFAMIKARILYGDPVVCERFTQMIKPFIYRRYIDYGVLEAIRRLKSLINQDLRRKQHGDNIKLGAGGIREIEFIAQAFQLIKGGRETSLQSRRLLEVLPEIAHLGLMSEGEVAQLVSSYLFLRKTENVLQAYADQQTQILPSSDEHKTLLAAALGFSHYQDFRITLDQHRDAAHTIFTSVFGAPTPLSEKPTVPNAFRKLWLQQITESESLALLTQNGYGNPNEVLEQVLAFRQSTLLRQLSERARVRVDLLLPQLIAECAQFEFRQDALLRTLSLIKNVCRRTAYLELLSENHAALKHLVKLCGESVFISQLLTQYPILLDDLLDTNTLYQAPAPDLLRGELQLALLRVERNDQELLMENLREFRHSQMLRVAASNLVGTLDIVQVSQHLTALAEAILAEVLEIAWFQMTLKHGKPDNAEHDKPFLIIGYGKLGGSELSFSSDLDIVFLFDGQSEGETDGEKPIGVDQFYTRLAQRIMHLLNTRTAAGILYEVDTRLRPSGSSGLLVCSFDAYQQYQDDEAWTWEHQALVRARPVAGSERLATRFRELRRKVLTRPREPKKLHDDVKQMREKMRTALDKSEANVWDIKHGAGGMIDIEFLVQYWALKNAVALKTGLQFTHSVSLLEQLAERSLLSDAHYIALRDAYRNYRDTGNRLALQDKPALVDESQFQTERASVSAIWQAEMADGEVI